MMIIIRIITSTIIIVIMTMYANALLMNIMQRIEKQHSNQHNDVVETIVMTILILTMSMIIIATGIWLLGV